MSKVNVDVNVVNVKVNVDVNVSVNVYVESFICIHLLKAYRERERHRVTSGLCQCQGQC